MFGQGYYEEPRWVTQECCENYVEMYPNRANNFCCGAGGGAWASPYAEERILYGRVKAKQIKDTGAKLLIAPCHNCRDQIMKSLRKEYDFMDVEVKYLWELVADSLIIEPREEAEEE
jgi:Fe-S oxidoreductase